MRWSGPRAGEARAHRRQGQHPGSEGESCSNWWIWSWWLRRNYRSWQSLIDRRP